MHMPMLALPLLNTPYHRHVVDMHSRCIPGWSEQVQPLRDKSLFGTGSGWIVDDPEQELCLNL